MSRFLQRKPPRRAPRAKFGGSIAAVIRLENGRQLTARLQQLSITGGLLDLETYLEERTWVELTVYLSCGPVRTIAEMLFPLRARVAPNYRQPFRFTSMGTEELHAVDREVTEWLKKPVPPREANPGLRKPGYYFET